MANSKIKAPPNPTVARETNLKTLRGKGSNRSAAETSTIVDALVDEVLDLRARIASLTTP